MPICLRFLMLGLILAVPGLAQAANSFALVIGINEYKAVPSLDGARNDAEDIATALSRKGTTRIISLMDREATKQNIVNAWTTLLNDAREGDTIFVTYAGHGAQIKQIVQGDENDGLDEFWVLPGFDPKNLKETWKESVFDNELHQWFTEAGTRGIKVVFVSDSCHAGGMNRAVRGKLRYVEFGDSRVLGELLAMVSGSAGSSAVAEPESRTPANVTMLAATSEALPVPEVVIEGRSRGALSWAFARAVEGKADRNADGTVTRIELEDYVLATVRMRSESLQTPVFTPVAARDANEALFGVTQMPEMASSSVRPAEKTGRRPMVRARELGFDPLLPLTVKGTDVMPEDIEKGAHTYEWDATTGLFRSPNGDVVAEKVSAFTVNDIVSKFILLDFLKAIASQNPGKIIVSPEKQIYLASEHIKFEAIRGDYKNMLVFNLANTGEIQFLDMVLNGEPQFKTPLKEVQVVEPFGSDHLVVISSDESLEAIGAILQRGVTPKELLAALSQRIDGTDSSIAILPLYTRVY
ncbi:caspase family protein [Rhizobium sp. LjRoot254]|uniref:caspase family protein n=1 Tax=Rhizobium sp. LjRoot254 TaxID=3342297 RepID=UPI003ECFF0BA